MSCCEQKNRRSTYTYDYGTMGLALEVAGCGGPSMRVSSPVNCQNAVPLTCWRARGKPSWSVACQSF